MEKEYLGDAVYADILDGELVLTTEDGATVTGVIFFNREALTKFKQYIAKWEAENAQRP